MKTTTFLLCAALATLPMQSRAPEPDVQSEWLFGAVVVIAAVAIVGSAIYVVNRCDKNAKNQEKCYTCQTPNRRDADSCANCGAAIRCEDCDTRLPKDAKKCPSCETPVPPPKKTLSLIQSSTDGITWTNVAPANQLKFYPQMEVLRFTNETEFGSWMAGEEVVSMFQIPAQQKALFRLSSN